MNFRNCSFFTLLISAMLLLSFSSLFANVTVTYKNELTPGFMYNTTGNLIDVDVVVTGTPVAAFDLISEIRSTVTDAFGDITAVDLSAINPYGGYDMTRITLGSLKDTLRTYGYVCGANVMNPGTYTFTFTVTASFDTGRFEIRDGGTWVVDPDPVIAFTSFIQQGATPAPKTINPGLYRVFNTAPVIDCPDSGFIRNACAVITYDFNGTDPDSFTNPPVWTRTGGSAGGTINSGTGVFFWDPPNVADMCGMYDLTVRFTDEWGIYDECTVTFTLVTDAPEFVECPTAESKTAGVWGDKLEGQVIANDPDDCPVPLAYSLVSFNGPGSFVVLSDGTWYWQTIFCDTTYIGTFEVFISVTDGCKTALCSFTVEVTGIRAQIEKYEKAIPGHIVPLSVYVEGYAETFGGFDFLIAYDASALTLIKADPGDQLLKGPGTQDNWEYFTYRFGPFGNCDGPCPSGFVRLVAIADMNYGASHPVDSAFYLRGEVAKLKFLLTSSMTFECQYLPVGFFWFDCGDNALSDKSGDTLYLDRYVYWFNGATCPPCDSFRIEGTHSGYGGWQSLGVDCLKCTEFYTHYYINQVGDTVWFALDVSGDTVSTSFDRCKNRPLPWIDFYDGGIDVACADSIDKRGDLNLNGVENEIADAVLYTNFFIYGDGVFSIAYDGQVAASDVNNDGRVLTVGDLVYLIRIITGDELPYPKMSPFSADADLHVVNGNVTSSSSDRIGALYMTFKADADYSIVNHTSMEVLQGEHDGLVHVLVYSGMNNMTNAIPAGNNELLTVAGGELVSVQASDYYGNMMNVRVEKTVLPTAFALYQNVPNPFNPTTKIVIDLPVVTDWKLDIYNVNGQLIESYNGTNLGRQEIEWNAKVASGVYFYKLTAGAFTDTKKMVLMK